MCCLTQDPANPYTAYIIDCCTLKITNADGTLVDTFNLNDLDYQIANGILYLKDGVNTRTINVADAPAIFGLVDIAAVLAWIDASVTDCKCVTTPPPVPVTLDVLNCDGTTTPIIFDSAPAKVEIVQTRPFVMCKSNIDFEIGCSSIDGRTIVRTYIQNEDGTITSAIFEQDGVTPVADGSILVKCDIDIEDVEFCFQDITDTTIRYRQVVFVNTATNAVVSTIWIDSTGVAIVAPSNIEPCADADEIDLLHTNWLPICVDGVQWYVADKYTYNNITGIEGIPVKVYKQGANGAIVTVAPTGTVIADGICAISQPVPYSYGCIGIRDTETIPNTYGFNLVADFGTTDATDTYFHAIDDNVGGITYTYPPATGNPTTPIVATNVAAIQSFLTSIGSGITYTVNAFNEIVLTYATPGDENRWSFWMGTSAPDQYTNKLLPTLHDLQVDTQTFQQVQVVKFQQLDGTFIDRFFVPSGDVLVEVNLKPENTFKFGECPTKPAPQVFDILERGVCGTIDGSADTYELIRVYTRNPTTGASTILFYEDKFGNQITGVVVEVCCTCDTLCTVAPALPLLSSVTAYARSLIGQCGDKFVIGAGIQWQVKIYQNGALILNSTTSPILTSQAAAFTWLDSNAGGYWLNTTTLPWAFANNINTYQFVSPTDPDEYLMILTETGNGASYCGGNLTSFRWAFTNRGISFGASCDNADAFAWSDLWADRTGWDWKC